MQNFTPDSAIEYLVLDTETTGLDHQTDRIVEFAAVPIEGLTPSIHTYQQYFNPECEVSAGSYKIHGLSTQFLNSFPTFAQKAKEIYEYLQRKILIIHNATFDINFLNAEFKRCGFPALNNQIIDTLHMARTKYPGKRASLDALCTKFNVNLTERNTKGHGALLDSQLLSVVYLKMITEQKDILLDETQTIQTNQPFNSKIKVQVSIQEQENRKLFINSL